MKKIEKVALIGAGAIGCYFIDCFAKAFDEALDKAEGFEFCVVADGDRKKRLEAEGLTVNGKILKPQIKTPKEAGEQDLILIATKYMALDQAISYLSYMMGENTLVLSLLNGVDSEERVAAAVGWNHVINSLMRISSERRNGQVTYTLNPDMGLFFGVTADQTEEPAAGAADTLSAFFTKAGVYYHALDNILEDMWYKYASNIANNLPQAVLGVPAKLYETADGLYLLNTLWAEVRSIATAKGIRLPAEPCVWKYQSARYSTLQDLEAGRKTEIDMFTGTLMRMAAENGLTVPCAASIHHLIKALEVKNEGFYEGL